MNKAHLALPEGLEQELREIVRFSHGPWSRLKESAGALSFIKGAEPSFPGGKCIGVIYDEADANLVSYAPELWITLLLATNYLKEPFRNYVYSVLHAANGEGERSCDEAAEAGGLVQ